MLFFVVCVAFVPSVTSSDCPLGQHCPSCTETTGDCQEECYIGYFGRRCNIHCSRGCRDEACRLSREGTGVCTQGCIRGYHGSTCRAPCLQSPCCHRCSQECEEGYCQEDKTCFASCQDSFYGANCTSCASSCKRCNRATGQCEECEQGYGGTDCTLHCKNCIGQCRGGCSGRCRSGYFGKFCENSCSEGCRSDCDVTTGDCACKPGWYGKDCRRACNVNCHGGLCDGDGRCSATQSLISSTDGTTRAQRGLLPDSSATQHIWMTVPTLVAIVGSLVVIVIIILIYFSCYFKRIRTMIYGKVQLRRQNSSVERSTSRMPNVEAHEYDDVVDVATGPIYQEVGIPMPAIAEVFGVVTSDNDDGNIAETQEVVIRNPLYESADLGTNFSYIHPIHVSS